MGDWPLQGSGAMHETAGAVTVSSEMTDVTASASTNTKGSWVQLIAATDFEASGILIRGGDFQSGGRHFLLDVAIGAEGSEIILIPDLAYMAARGSPQAPGSPLYYFFPLRVPQGVRLSVRVASSTASSVLNVGAYLFSGNFMASAPFNRVTAHGTNSSLSKGTIVDPGADDHAKANTEIVASTTNPIRALVIGETRSQLDGATTPTERLQDVSVGASAGQPIISNLASEENNEENVLPVWPGPYPCDIPAGSRLSINGQSDNTNATDRVWCITLYGLD